MTKRLTCAAVVLQIFSWLLTIAPILIFGGLAFMNGEPGQKFVLGMSLLFMIAIVIINALMKINMRSALWLVVLAIFSINTEQLMPFLWTMTITTIADEIICEPLVKHYKTRAAINKELDNRYGNG